MIPVIQGYAAAIFDDARAESGGAARLLEDLQAVEATLLANADLRAALTDTAVHGPARRAILSDLLAGKVGSLTVRVASFAAGSAPAQEVPNAISWLVQRAAEVAQEATRDEPVLSYMAGRQRVGGYASCLFEELNISELEQIEDDLFRFARTVESNRSLRGALSNRDLPASVRGGVVDQLLAGKVQPATLRLVHYVLVGGRARDTLNTLDWLVVETARARGWRVARVHAATEVDSNQQEQLANSLRSLTGAPVELQVNLDPALLSGIVVEVGDLLVDASVRGRLDQLRELIAPAGWEDAGFADAGGGRHREEQD